MFTVILIACFSVTSIQSLKDLDVAFIRPLSNIAPKPIFSYFYANV